MSAFSVFLVIFIYFGFLFWISIFTSHKANTKTFFNANKKAPWYLVAYGMIGASLSGVTFISVPGWVKDSHFTYFQMVLGYLAGYLAIAVILLPLYYRLNLVSIYSYLEKRFGKYSYKTGSAFFLISRIIGAAFRMFLVVSVLQMALFDKLGIPFVFSVVITIFLIWVYTYRAGIKTIVWTDTLQTTFMILAVVISIWTIAGALNLDFGGLFTVIKNHKYSQIFDWDWRSKTFFGKQFLSGAFIAFVMTGLDQDMMQKNLTVKTLKESQKNMFWFSLSLLPINLLFLSLGLLLYYFADTQGIILPDQGDNVFPFLALNYFGIFAGISFLVGIIAAAFSSADSALTALTTAFSIDFLNLDINRDDSETKTIKNIVHLGVSLVLLAVIMIFKSINDQSVISQIFKVAGYTYGPLLGLFVFGMLTKRKIRDKLVPVVAVLSPVISYFLKFIFEKITPYRFGFEFLILNGLIMFLGLYFISFPANKVSD